MLNSIVYLGCMFWFLSASIAAAVDQPLQLTAEERAWIKAQPVVTVANEMDWPPFDYVDNGKPAGYSIDVVRLIAEKTGLQIEFVNGFTWQELLQQFRGGDIDIMPAIYINDERKRYTAFTRNYYSQPQVMVVHQSNKEINGVDALSGKRVAGITGFTTTRALQENVPGIIIVPVENVLEGLKAVSLGKAEAFIESIGTVSYTMGESFVPHLKIIDKVNNDALANPGMHMGVSSENRLLHSILDKALASISKQEKAALSDEWFSLRVDRPVEKSTEVNLTDEQRAWLKAHPVIRLATDIAWPPFEYVAENREYRGMAADYMSLVEEKLGIRFEVQKDKSWTDVVEDVKQHRLDVYSCVVSNEQRKEYVSFTRPYLSFPMVMVTRDTISYLDGMSDLKGMRVGVVDGYATHDYLQGNHPELKVITSETTKEGLQAVSQGKIDVFVDNMATVSYLIQEGGLTNIKVSGEMPIRYELGMAVRKDWPELVGMLQLALDAISDEQRMQIHNKWIGIRYDYGFDYELLWKFLGAFLFIVGFLYIYNRKLAREINQRKQVELKLQELNKNLVKAKDEAEKANQAKTDFLSSMSHELRTPMNAILGFSQLLQMDLKEKQDKDKVDEIFNAGQHLLGLINEVLNLSRIEAGKIELDMTTVDLDQIVSESLSMISTHANARAIRIVNNISDGPKYTLHADYSRLKQVFLNLLSNAVKYNAEGGSVTLDCNETAGGRLRIMVTDTGKGLSIEAQQKLFRPFERIGAEHSGVEGTGIGLVITKQLIEKMGGSIGCASQVGKGSSFWVDALLSKE